MTEVKIKQPSKETTVFELKIERLRQVVLWTRGLYYLAYLVSFIAGIGLILKSPVIRLNEGQIAAVALVGVMLYIVTLVLDFLADLGIIVLSMKKESQYVTKVVQQVQERQR